MRNKPLTVADLIELLREYPPDTPVFHAKDSDLFAHHVTETKYDDWANSTPCEDGEIPGIGTAIHIGRRF